MVKSYFQTGGTAGAVVAACKAVVGAAACDAYRYSERQAEMLVMHDLMSRRSKTAF
jgi:hypothetical protein